MKYALVLIVCSQLQNDCYPPLISHKEFLTKYDCLQEGYKDSQTILDGIGKDQVNAYDIIVKFICKEKNKNTI
jgi:hypothetical protein